MRVEDIKIGRRWYQPSNTPSKRKVYEVWCVANIGPYPLEYGDDEPIVVLKCMGEQEYYTIPVKEFPGKMKDRVIDQGEV